MRKLVIALTAAAGFALLPSTGALAAPFGGTALDNAATSTAATIDVGYRHRCCCCCRPHWVTVVKWKKVWCCGCPRWIKVKVRVKKWC